MIVPTFAFLVYLLILAAIYFFRMAYIGWLGPYYLAAAVAIPVCLLLLSLPSMLRAKLRLVSPERCTRGEKAALRLCLSGMRLLPLSSVRVRVSIENRFTGDLIRKTLVLRGTLNGEGELSLPTGLCGDLRCRVLFWECRDLLGLFSLRRRSKLEARCAVLPSPVAPDKPIDLSALLNQASQLKPKYGGGYSEDHDLREYRPGDTVNSIHWKLSCKTDAIIVREPLVNANEDVYLVLSRVGVEDRGLELLYWLSLELCKAERAHILVADRQYPVENEEQCAQALTGILSKPLGEPCSYDPAKAAAIFLISCGEVRAL